jgi:phosphohistidine phosphatase
MADTHTLYVVRHAIAAPQGPEYPDDSKRPLTERGTTRFRKVVDGLVELGVDADVILSSPFVRARETADILSSGLRGHPAVVETTSLVPGATYEDLLAELRRHARANAVVLVGHDPTIGEIAARLVGSTGRFDFKKGGVCRIDVGHLPPGGPGRVVWFAPPRMLIALRG